MPAAGEPRRIDRNIWPAGAARRILSAPLLRHPPGERAVHTVFIRIENDGKVYTPLPPRRTAA